MPLISLPTELTEQIASHLDLPACRCLRLVCSSLRQQTSHDFRDRYFRTRTLKWTKESLDTLLEVTLHPDFGNALQNLSIDATPRHSIHLWSTRKRISEAQAIFGPYNANSAKSKLEVQYMNDNKVAEELATFFNETRYDQKCLTNVFTKLGKLERIVFEYEGMDKKYGKFGRKYCESSQHEMSRPFVSTMAAIASTSLSVKVISNHHIKNHGAISIGRLESLAPSLRNFDAVLASLKVLQLNLRDWRYPDSGFELETHRAPFVVRFLAKARNVKELDLSCYSSLDDDLFGEMGRHCAFAHLESCKLSLFRINDAVDLISFLAHSSATLKSLKLNHVVLRDESSTWLSLLRSLGSDPAILPVLEELELVNLFTRMGARMSFDLLGMMTSLSLNSISNAGIWREDLLSRIDGFSEGSSGPAWHLAAVAYPFVGLRT